MKRKKKKNNSIYEYKPSKEELEKVRKYIRKYVEEKGHEERES